MASDRTGADGADDESQIEVKVADHRSASNLDDDSARTPDADGAAEAPTDELGDLKAQVAQLDARRQDLLNRLTRVQADFANYRRRTTEEAQEIAKFANQAFAFELLSVMDALERAFASIPSELRLLTWIDGMALIQAQFSRVLETAGVTPIDCRAGDPIDVEVHEVVMTEGAEATAVVAEMQRGYRMHDRVIRPALVKAGPKPETLESPEEDGRPIEQSQNDASGAV
ncbi:MAG: nucleotide exchange factor GrpE [Chloroflexota bacterium]|nr:nucleotide exchange factor GrpE [Chloroflexota bacterium]MDE2918569.1 nucleotide exchange factor GrpE [Chloroflexota bacterium]